jgi:hypothetical protein
MPMQIIYATVLGTAMLLPAQLTERTVKTSYLACNPERQYEHAERLRASGDSKGLQAFTAGALLSGTCVSLTPGASVFSVGAGKGPGIVRVRPKGSFKTFFTSALAFE